MVKKTHILSFVFILFLIYSCGFPGPIITYNKEIESSENDSLTEITKEMNYFCFDYHDTQCDKWVDIYKDKNGKIKTIVIMRGSNLRMKDGCQKRKTRIKEYDSNGKIIRKYRTHFQTYGRTGRMKHSKEKIWNEEGKIIKTHRGSKKNPNKLDKTRVKGGLYK